MSYIRRKGKYAAPRILSRVFQIGSARFSPSVRQQLHQPLIDEEDFLAGFHFGHEACGGEVVEVAGGGDAVAEAGFLAVADFALEVDEELHDGLFGKRALRLL